MKLNSTILGLVLVLGGCEAEMSDLNKSLPDTGTATATGSATRTGVPTGTGTGTTTLSATATGNGNGTGTGTTTKTTTQLTSLTSTNTNTTTGTANSGTNTGASTATSTAAVQTQTWTQISYSLTTTAVAGYGYTTALASGIVTQTATYTGTSSPTTTQTARVFNGVGTYTVIATQILPMLATVAVPVNVKNPCFAPNSACYALVPASPTPGTTQQALATCGWDSVKNACYATPWCEPSVASTQANGIQPGLNYLSPSYQRPASAKCESGQKTFTYLPGQLLMWGMWEVWSEPGITSSEYTSSYIRPIDGYLCVPNQQVITINC